MQAMRLCNTRPPCTPDCPTRAVGCHGQCAAYQRYAADRRAEYDRRLESKRLNWDCATYTPTHERARVRLQHARGKHK